jgi:hypothetical protein
LFKEYLIFTEVIYVWTVNSYNSLAKPVYVFFIFDSENWGNAVAGILNFDTIVDEDSYRF